MGIYLKALVLEAKIIYLEEQEKNKKNGKNDNLGNRRKSIS